MGHQVMVDCAFASDALRDDAIARWAATLADEGWTAPETPGRWVRDDAELDIDTALGTTVLTWWTPGCPHFPE